MKWGFNRAGVVMSMCTTEKQAYPEIEHDCNDVDAQSGLRLTSFIKWKLPSYLSSLVLLYCFQNTAAASLRSFLLFRNGVEMTSKTDPGIKFNFPISFNYKFLTPAVKALLNTSLLMLHHLTATPGSSHLLASKPVPLLSHLGPMLPSPLLPK